MTTNRAATHQGTCQVCSRLQMLPAGKLAKHGYTVEWGYFDGVCPGSDALPYELDKSLVEHYIPIAAAQAKSLAAFAKELAAKNDPSDVRMSVYINHKYVSLRGRLEFDAKDSGEYRAVYFVSTFQDQEVRDRLSGFEKDLTVPAARLHQMHAANVAGHAKMAQQWHDDLVRRRDEWKYAPEALVEVAPESRAETVHAVNSWLKTKGRIVALCSSFNSHSFKKTTEDRAQVNCKACLKSLAAQDADAEISKKADALIAEMVAKHGDGVRKQYSPAADKAIKEIRYHRKEIDKDVRKRATDRLERGA